MLNKIEQVPDSTGNLLMTIFNTLQAHYGPQSWWPSRSGNPWEIMLGAVLTQRTTWTNVELSISNMVSAWGIGSLSNPEIVLHASPEEMATVLRPTGFYSRKPGTLKNLASYVNSKGGAETFANSNEETTLMRQELLSLRGIGPETADAILLYALRRPTFVADAYALRLTSRWGLLPPAAQYDQIRSRFMERLPHDAALFGEYHALIVAHAKSICRMRPFCEVCPLNTALTVNQTSAHPSLWRCPRLYTVKQ